MRHDSLGRRRRKGQERGLRPMHPRLSDDQVSRSLRAVLSPAEWDRLDAMTAGELSAGAVSAARALGAVLSRLMAGAARDGRQDVADDAAGVNLPFGPALSRQPRESLRAAALPTLTLTFPEGWEPLAPRSPVGSGSGEGETGDASGESPGDTRRHWLDWEMEKQRLRLRGPGTRSVG